MKTLYLDLESAPALADVWSLWGVNVSLNQLRDPGGVISFAATWGESDSEMMFYSDHRDGKDAMIWAAHQLLDEADVVVGWNSRKFDIPYLNSEMILAGLKPPSPYKQIDLCSVAKGQFRFISNKLEFVSRQLGLDGKVSHEGHGLWVACMNGDEDAWQRMETYNKQDVALLVDLHKILMPWIPSPLSHAAFNGETVCAHCGSAHLQRRGYSYTAQSKRQRYQCQDCGGWSTSTLSESTVKFRAVSA